MLNLPVDIPQTELEAICRRYRVRRLALFGSVLRADFRRDSDVDILVEFEAGARIGWDIVTLEDELADLLGREVDLNTPASLSDTFRQQVLQTAWVLYERT